MSKIQKTMFFLKYKATKNFVLRNSQPITYWGCSRSMRSLTNSALMETFCIHESEREKSGKTRPLYFCVFSDRFGKMHFWKYACIGSQFVRTVFQHFILVFLEQRDQIVHSCTKRGSNLKNFSHTKSIYFQSTHAMGNSKLRILKKSTDGPLR